MTVTCVGPQGIKKRCTESEPKYGEIRPHSTYRTQNEWENLSPRHQSKMLHLPTANNLIRTHIKGQARELPWPQDTTHRLGEPTYTHYAIPHYIISSRTIHTHCVQFHQNGGYAYWISRYPNSTYRIQNPYEKEKRIPHTKLRTSEKTSLQDRQPKCLAFPRPTIVSERTSNSRPTNCPDPKRTKPMHDEPT